MRLLEADRYKQMNWKFIDSGLNTGLYNMDFDLMLAKTLKVDEAILRLYGWKPC